MRRGRTEPHLHLLNEDPQLQDAARRHQAAQKPAGVLCAAERPAGLHQGEVRGDLQDAAVRGGHDGLQRDPGAQPTGRGHRGRGGRGAGAGGRSEPVRSCVPPRRGAFGSAQPHAERTERLLRAGGGQQRTGAVLLQELLHGDRAVLHEQLRVLQQNHRAGLGHACGDHGGERVPPPGLLLRRAPECAAEPGQETESGLRLLFVRGGRDLGFCSGA